MRPGRRLAFSLALTCALTLPAHAAGVNLAWNACLAEGGVATGISRAARTPAQTSCTDRSCLPPTSRSARGSRSPWR